MKSIQHLLEQFKVEIEAGINGFVKAAEIYVAAIDQEPESHNEFVQRFDGLIPSDLWSDLELIGRKAMHPKLLLGCVPNKHKENAIRQLPFRVQNQIFSGYRFNLLLRNGDTMKVALLDATRNQFDQLCSGKSIRTVAEQKAYLEDVKTKESVSECEVMPYTITRGKCFIKRDIVLTRKEVKAILEQM